MLKATWKRWVAILAILMAAILITLSYLFFAFDLNQLKPLIQQTVREKTGYTLNIKGPLSWSYYPLLGIKIPQVTLQRTEESPPFLEMNTVKLIFSLTNIWHDHLQLKRIYSDSMNVFSLHAEKINASLSWEDDGALTLRLINASFYQGTLEGELRGTSLATTHPIWTFILNLKNADSKLLLNDLNKNKPMTPISLLGKATVKFQGTLQGNRGDLLLKHLNGRGILQITDGAIEGIDLTDYLKNAEAILQDKPIPIIASGEKKTFFRYLAATFLLKNGMATIQEGTLTTANLNGQVRGEINFLTQMLNLKGEISPALLDNKIQVPLLISGSFDHPLVQLDLLTLKTQLLKKELDKIIIRVSDEIKKLPEKADKLLQKWQGH